MRQRSERVESPGTYELNEFHEAIFAWPCVLSDRPPVLWWSSPGEEWDAVGINCRLVDLILIDVASAQVTDYFA